MEFNRRTLHKKQSSGRSGMNPLDVLVVDDSAVVREAMLAVLSQDDGINVVTAADPFIAMDKMKRKRPDVIILDLKMPRMDGITFLRKIMAEDPIPVVVCSGHFGGGSEMAVQAIDEGAVEIVMKPKIVQGLRMACEKITLGFKKIQ